MSKNCYNYPFFPSLHLIFMFQLLRNCYAAYRLSCLERALCVKNKTEKVLCEREYKIWSETHASSHKNKAVLQGLCIYKSLP